MAIGPHSFPTLMLRDFRFPALLQRTHEFSVCDVNPNTSCAGIQPTSSRFVQPSINAGHARNRARRIQPRPELGAVRPAEIATEKTPSLKIRSRERGRWT